MQEFVGWKHDRIILDSSFPVGPHTFRYYKFALPEGSVNVAVVGQFASAADDSSRAANRRDRTKAKKEEWTTISRSTFSRTQRSPFGRTNTRPVPFTKAAEWPRATVQADVPAGAGIYYLMFSNKFRAKAAKNVHATVLLRYKSWLPEWFRRMKGRFLDWTGA